MTECDEWGVEHVEDCGGLTYTFIAVIHCVSQDMWRPPQVEFVSAVTRLLAHIVRDDQTYVLLEFAVSPGKTQGRGRCRKRRWDHLQDMHMAASWGNELVFLHCMHACMFSHDGPRRKAYHFVCECPSYRFRIWRRTV